MIRDTGCNVIPAAIRWSGVCEKILREENLHVWQIYAKCNTE
jgi:hypothetical protein